MSTREVARAAPLVSPFLDRECWAPILGSVSMAADVSGSRLSTKQETPVATLPTPTPAELAAFGNNIRRWGNANGVCSYDGGAHEFAGQSYCRLCRTERAVLVRRAKGGVIYSKD